MIVVVTVCTHTHWVQIKTKISGGASTESQSAGNILVISVLTYFTYLQQTCAFMQMTLSFTWLPLLFCRTCYIISTCFFNPKNNPPKSSWFDFGSSPSDLRQCWHSFIRRGVDWKSDLLLSISMFELMIRLSFKVHTLNLVRKLKLKLGFYYRNEACLYLSVRKALVWATFRKVDGLWRHNQYITVFCVLY